jgi:peptidoglycan hydrolase-like protein with peptidoglycan-binding domain
LLHPPAHNGRTPATNAARARASAKPSARHRHPGGVAGGNQARLRALERAALRRDAEPPIAIGSPGDALERDADRVTDLVMPPGAVDATPRMSSREFARAEAERAGAATEAVTPPVAERLRARQGRGAPLAPLVRQFMEDRFGVDFASTRIHADGEAGDFARAIHAQAFALDRDIYFAPGAYRPDTGAGRRLIAHELAHVAQQAAGGRSASSPPTLRRMSEAGEIVKQDVYHFGVAGADHRAQTDSGSTVKAWKPYAPWSAPYESQYWCHGLSFGTFFTFGYSVYSGDKDAGTVLGDEWFRLAAPEFASTGDIAAWWDPSHTDENGDPQPGYAHSAIFRQVVLTPGLTLDPDQTILETKNGGQAQKFASLADLNKTYPVQAGGSLRVFGRGNRAPVAPASDLVGLTFNDGITYGTWDRRPRIRRLQTELKEHGATITVDGMFGDETAAALHKFRVSVGLGESDTVDQATADALKKPPPPGQPATIGHIEGLQLNDGITFGTWERRPGVRELQQRLTDASFPCDVDGMFGPQTLEALHGYQAANGLAQGDAVDRDTANSLEGRMAGTGAAPPTGQ